ncbi:MAG TPA: phage tail tape measure protein, partial [Methanospirillum sp.]|uniref:phage tail tape measure protein n=1 Tax=Methanospirillum sp. TaxID=45200 RepID=UPI002C25AAA2
MSDDNSDIQVTMGVDASPIERAFQEAEDKASDLAQSLQSKFADVGLGEKIKEQVDQANEAFATLGTSANVVVPVSADTTPAEDQIASIGSEVPPVEIPVSVSGSDQVDGLKKQVDETQSSTEDLKDTFASPWVITGGDVTNTLNSWADKINQIAESTGRGKALTALTSTNTGISAAELSKQAIDLSDEEASISELKALQNELSKSGVITINQMGETIPKIKEFAKSIDTDVVGAFDKLDPAFKQFDVSVKDQGQYYDQMSKFFNTTHVDINDFATSMARVGPEISNMGGSLTDAMGILDAFNQHGITGRKATSDFNTALSEANQTAKDAGRDTTLTDFYDALTKKTGISRDEFEKWTETIKNSQGAAKTYAEDWDKADTTLEKINAQVAKYTAGLKGMVSPLEPVAAGVATLGAGVAQFAIIDKVLNEGSGMKWLSTVAADLPLIGTGAATAVPEIGGLSTALTTLAGPAVLGALAIGIGAYATNLGGFRDDINNVGNDISKTISDIKSQDFEAAGRYMAQAVADGFGSVGDLLIKGMPQAAQVVSGFESGAEQAMQGAAHGMAEGALSSIASTGEEWVSAGESAANSYLTGFSHIDLSSVTSSIINQLSSIDLTSIGSKAGESFLNGLNPVLKGVAGGVEDWILKQVGLSDQDLKDASKKISDKYGILGAPISTAANLFSSLPNGESSYQKQLATNSNLKWVSGSASPSILGTLSSNPFLPTGDTESLHQATTQQVTAISLLQDKYKISAADAQKMYDSSANLREKYDQLASAASEETKATKDSTASKKKLTDYTGKSLDDATRSSINANEDSFTLGGKTYKINNQTGKAESQSLSDVISTNQAEASAKQVAEDTKKQQSEIEKSQKQREAAQERYNNSIQTAADNYAKAEENASIKRQRAIEDLNISDKNYAEKRADIDKTYNRALEDAARNRKDAEDKAKDALGTTSDATKTNSDAVNTASETQKTHTSTVQS